MLNIGTEVLPETFYRFCDEALFLASSGPDYFFINGIIVPTPLEGGGEELYTQMGFFCSVNFGRSIYSS